MSVAGKLSADSVGKTVNHCQQVPRHMGDLELAVFHIHILEDTKQTGQHCLLFLNLLANRSRRAKRLHLRRDVFQRRAMRRRVPPAPASPPPTPASPPPTPASPVHKIDIKCLDFVAIVYECLDFVIAV